MFPNRIDCFSDGERDLMFHKNPLVETVASLHSLQSHTKGESFARRMVDEKIQFLDEKTRYNLEMYGKSYANWLLIMDVATYISCLYYDKTGETEMSFYKAMEEYMLMDDVTFAYIFLGLSAGGFSIDDARALIENPNMMQPRLLRFVKQYISPQNINIFICNIHSLKADLAEVLISYWEQVFKEVWQVAENSIEKAIKTGKYECKNIGNCVQYISNFHNDIYITKEQLYLKKDISYMLPLNKIKQFHIFPSAFPEEELLIDIFGDSLVIYYNLNLYQKRDDAEVLESLLGTFKALGDETRLRIIKLLWGAPATTQYLSSVLGLAQSTVSAHLKVLKSVGILKNKTIKKYVYYEINQTVLENIEKKLFDYVKEE